MGRDKFSRSLAVIAVFSADISLKFEVERLELLVAHTLASDDLPSHLVLNLPESVVTALA